MYIQQRGYPTLKEEKNTSDTKGQARDEKDGERERRKRKHIQVGAKK